MALRALRYTYPALLLCLAWITGCGGGSTGNPGTIPTPTPSPTPTPTPTPTPKPATGVVFNPANGHYYERVNARLPWNEAMAAAILHRYKGLGGHLATITSAEESAFLVAQFGSRLGATQLGGRQERNEADPALGWSWVTGEPWSYTNWAAAPVQEPNDFEGLDEDFLEISPRPASLVYAGWNDVPGDVGEVTGYLVEYE